MTATCSECHQPLADDAKFCGQCGAKACIAPSNKRRRFHLIWWIGGAFLVVFVVVPFLLALFMQLGEVGATRQISEDSSDPRYDSKPMHFDNRAALVANMSRERVLNYKWASRDELRSVFGTPYNTSLTGDREYWYYRDVSRDPVTGRRDRSVQFVIDVDQGKVIAINF